MDHFLKRICVLSELYLNFRLSTGSQTGPISVWWTAWLTLFNYCAGVMVAVRYLESGDIAEGRGMMREDEQSPWAGGSSRGCLVLSRTQFLGLRGRQGGRQGGREGGKSPPDDQLYSAVLGNSNTLRLFLSCHISVFLGQQT